MLILAACGWGFGVTGSEFALAGFRPMPLLTVELAAATGVLWTVLLIRGHRRPPPGAYLLGLFEPGLAYAALNLGLAGTTAANAALLGSGMETIFVVVLAALLLRERTSPAGLAGVALTVVGVVALDGTAPVGTVMAGDAIIVLSALACAVYTILAVRIAPGADPLSLTAHQFATGLAVSLALLFTRETPSFGAAPRFWAAAILTGVLGMAVPFLLFNRAITRTPAGQAAVLCSLIPVFALAGAVGWLGERLTAAHVAGGALILSGIVVHALFNKGDEVPTTLEELADGADLLHEP